MTTTKEPLSHLVSDPIARYDLVFDDCEKMTALCLWMEMTENTALADFGIFGPPVNIKARFLMTGQMPPILSKIIKGERYKGGVTLNLYDAFGNQILTRRFRVKSASSKIRMAATDYDRQSRRKDTETGDLYERLDDTGKWNMRQSAEIRDLLVGVINSKATLPTAEILFIEDSK